MLMISRLNQVIMGGKLNSLKCFSLFLLFVVATVILQVSVMTTNIIINENKKCPQIVGLRPPMCLQIF